MVLVKIALFFIVALLIGCGSIRDNTPIVKTVDGISIKPYFSLTQSNYKDGGGVDELIIDDINSAQKTIRLAIYGFSNDKIRDAILEAYKRGVDTIIVTDDKRVNQENIQILKSEGITIIDDQNPSALMHHKFLVIDGNIVWSGSANYNYYSFYKNNENLVKFKSSKVAKVYLEEFGELYTHVDKEGAYVSDTLEIYFSPEDDFEQRLLSLMESAKKSIDFLAFAFTSKPLADALKKKFENGIKIRGVYDKRWNSSSKYSTYNSLLSYGLNVKLDGNNQTLHDKIFIIDDKTVVTGSYNFTNKANEANNENAIVVHNSEFASRYEDEFEDIYAIAK